MPKDFPWASLIVFFLCVVLAAVLLPVAIGIALVWIAYLLWRKYQDSPGVRSARMFARANALYERASALVEERTLPRLPEFSEGIWRQIVDRTERYPCHALYIRLVDVEDALYKWERFRSVPAPSPEFNELDGARYCDALSALIAKLSLPEIIQIAQDTIADAHLDFLTSLPPLALRTAEAALAERDAIGDGENPPSELSVRLLDILPNPARSVEDIILPFYAERVKATGLFATLRSQLDRNLHEMSSVPYTPENYDSPDLVIPTKYDGTPEEIVRGYLHDTPFEWVFFAEIPFTIPEAVRFEHHWIIAGSGHGKTQTLQYLIAKDLERVAEGRASVVIIDSQGDLIKNLSGLKCFAPGEPLHGRLCLIDPTDIEYPVALNLFDMGLTRLGQYGALDRERLMNGVLELYDYVLSSLLSAELTQKQSVLFRYLTRLMLHIPDATVHTFRELMEEKGYERYRSYIKQLDGTARAFFETEFNSKQFEDTKRQVLRRLWGILENRTFERMFSHPHNKLDLFAEMNAGKVILINTAKELLKQNGTEIFGRFFIALIAQAAQERATLLQHKRLPTFVYIDECADYLDQNVSTILEQARKFNIGMVLAHQYVGQLSPKLQESFAANTSIKFAGGVSDKDARALSHMLRCLPEFIESQPKGHFAVAVRNMTQSAVSLRIPFGYLEALPRMTLDEFVEVRADMRERYAVPWEDLHYDGQAAPDTGEPAPEPPPEAPKPPPKKRKPIDISPKEW